jgi:hypothetical protein
MCKLCQFYAVFLAQQALIMPAFLDIVDLDGFVALGRHAQLAWVVEVDRQNVGLWLALLNVVSLEQLERKLGVMRERV